MSPDPDDCMHEADVELADGSIECDRCGRRIEPANKPAFTEGVVIAMSPRDAIDLARRKTEAARQREKENTDE